MKKMARFTQLHPSLHLIQSSAQISLNNTISSFNHTEPATIISWFSREKVANFKGIMLWKAEMHCSCLVEKTEFSDAVTNFSAWRNSDHYWLLPLLIQFPHKFLILFSITPESGFRTVKRAIASNCQSRGIMSASESPFQPTACCHGNHCSVVL